MPHETATKDACTAFPARPAGHSIGGMVAIEPGSPARLPEASIVAPLAFPGLALAIPADVSPQIDALTRSGLDGAGLADLPAFHELAIETTFGPDAGRLAKAGLPRPLAASVARWGSALFHLGTRLADARQAARWASNATARAVDRRKAKNAVDMRLASRLIGQWGGRDGAEKLWQAVHARLNAEAPPVASGATCARLDAYQLEGRLRYLLATGGIPSRMATGLAATFDGAGWSETACMLAGEMTVHGAGTRKVDRPEVWIANAVHGAVRWIEHSWRHVDFSHVPTLGFFG